MGSATSGSIARSEEENPSLNKSESSLITQDGEESKTLVEDSNETKEKEEDDSEECGFCTYIKAGECKESWIELENCVDEAKKNDGERDVTKCREARKMFKTCLYDNPVYHEPFIAAETYMVAKMLSDRQARQEAFFVDKAQAVAKMLSELQAEKEAILSGDTASIFNAVNKLQQEEEQRIDILPAEAEVIAKRFSEFEARKKKDKEEKEAKGSEEN